MNAVVFVWRHVDIHRNLALPSWCSSPTRTELFWGQSLPAHVNQSDRRNGQPTGLTSTQGKRHTCRRSTGPSTCLVDNVPIFSTRSAATLHLSSRTEPSCCRIVHRLVAIYPSRQQRNHAKQAHEPPSRDSLSPVLPRGSSRQYMPVHGSGIVAHTRCLPWLNNNPRELMPLAAASFNIHVSSRADPITQLALLLRT